MKFLMHYKNYILTMLNYNHNFLSVADYEKAPQMYPTYSWVMHRKRHCYLLPQSQAALEAGVYEAVVPL